MNAVATPQQQAARRPATYHCRVRLADHTPLVLRAIRPDDRERLDAHFHRLSEDSVAQRFFEAKRRLTDRELDFYTELDFDRHFALVVVLEEDGGERIVGVGRAIESGGQDGGHGDGERVAEVAFAVADELQGRGIGRLLLQHLAILGRALGYDAFEAWALPANGRMTDVFVNSGYTVTRTLADGALHFRFPITPVPEGEAPPECAES